MSAVQSKAALPEAPIKAQNPEEVAEMVRLLEDSSRDSKDPEKKKKSKFRAKRNRFNVDDSPTKIQVDGWKFNESDYKLRDLPTYARGLFTSRRADGQAVISVRGYDKFFNVNEVRETRWEFIEQFTRGPYELTLKENGCIIFVSGLEDDTLLVCSKHSTGDRTDAELSHSTAGARRLEAQLLSIGRSKADLARELYRRNATAVAELCDDSFEEHILAYGPDKAGLYLHGINVNLPQFMTYPSVLVQDFAAQWGFTKTDLIMMDKVADVRTLLERVAESGSYDGRDVEGFVVRCKMSPKPESMPFVDWFFKYKFEEPYLMYRQWRECTKALIAARKPMYKRHQVITEEYLMFARKRLAADPNLSKLYVQNHGIIQLRDDFLAFKKMNGSDAAKFQELFGTDGQDDKNVVEQDVILVPISTIGCGKTTIALALGQLLGYGHVQNDNITGRKRPLQFTSLVLKELQTHPVVLADRNNSQRREREQIMTDVREQHINARLVALNFLHKDKNEVRKVAQQRVFARGNNHQTIQAASEPEKAISVMDGFLEGFQPCNPLREPDSGFDAIIDLDPTEGSRTNVERVIRELHRIYPKLVREVPRAEVMDEAVQTAIHGYHPTMRHTIPDRGMSRKQDANRNGNSSNQTRNPKTLKPLEYMAVQVAPEDVLSQLKRAFGNPGSEGAAAFFGRLQKQKRVQTEFHVTLMHRVHATEQPELWERYKRVFVEAAKAVEGSGAVVDPAKLNLGQVDVLLERIICDDRLMAIVVRLVNRNVDGEGGDGRDWVCVNRVSHITVGTRDVTVKPKESNDLLDRWMAEGCTEANMIIDVPIEGWPKLAGVVRGVLSR